MLKHVRASALILLSLTACKEQAAPPPMPLPKVAVSTPLQQTLTENTEYTGRFEASQRVEVKARVSGALDAAAFTDGQRVKKGQLLFVIDPRPFRIALDRAQAQQKLAHDQFARAVPLREQNALSQDELDRSRQALQTADADVRAAQLALDFTQVRAPIDGRIGRRLIDVGNTITADVTPLAVVTADRPMYFYFEVGEAQWLKIQRLNLVRDGLSVRAKLQDEAGFPRVGRLDFSEPEVDRGTGTVGLRAVFDNRDGALLPGLFGRVRMADSQEYAALLVPDEAVSSNQAQNVVMTLNADNVIEPRPVVLGPLHNGKKRIIREGLQPGDRLVWSGVAKVRPGMKVEPVAVEPGAGS